MPKTVPNPPPGFDDLSIGEQIEYVQSLWDRIAAGPDKVPSPEWHLQILRERKQRSDAAPGQRRPWEEVRGEIEQELRGS